MRFQESGAVLTDVGEKVRWRVGGLAISETRRGNVIAIHASENLLVVNRIICNDLPTQLTGAILETLLAFAIAPTCDDQWRVGWDPQLVATWE